MKTSETLACVTFAILTHLAGSVSAQTGDRRAGYLELFGASGAGNARLSGLQAPVIGGAMRLQVQAPGSAFAATFLTVQSNPAGTCVDYLGSPLCLYADLASFLVAIPMPLANGQGQLQLPLPPDPRLIGLDLAWQSVAFSPSLHQVSASNLLLANIGDRTDGAMVFASFTPHNIKIKPGECYDVPYATGVAGAVTITGERNPPGQDVEVKVYDDRNREVSSITVKGDGKGNKAWGTTVSVPAGGTIKICNPGTPNKTDVTISLESITFTR
jgi:hypothetical protein